MQSSIFECLSHACHSDILQEKSFDSGSSDDEATAKSKAKNANTKAARQRTAAMKKVCSSFP